MKKLYVLLIALVMGSAAQAQTFANAGMETWRSGTAGFPYDTVIDVHAPGQWYGFDSLIIVNVEFYLTLLLADTPKDLHAQLFQENTLVHSGTSSAKLMTLYEDTLHYFPGLLTNAVPAINAAALTGGGSAANAVSFSGGTPITGPLATVSAWVQYMPGLDSVTHLPGGIDSGTLTVQVFSHVHTPSGIVDSAVGTAFLTIGPTTGWTQVTATVNYTDSLDGADTARIIFSSSGFTGALDSSTLYVDDVTMVYHTPFVNAVQNVNAASDLVKVYPNPASGILYMNAQGSEGASFQLLSVNGQVVATKTLTGNDNVDISLLPEGLYLYTISDKGSVIQRGKVSVVR